MTEQMKAATIRALYGALLTAALTLLVTYQGGGRGAAGWEEAWLAAGIAFVGYMLSRGMVEGLIDSGRAARGEVTAADVGAGGR